MEQTKSISKKRLLAIMLSLAMLFSLVQGGIFTVNAAISGDYEYTVLKDGTVEITGYNGSDTELTIPSTLDGKTVTSIGSYAFMLCQSLTSVTIGNSVESIGNSAFNNCESLTSIDIPDSVKSIGSYAFMLCQSLTSVTIGKGITSIGSSVFYNTGIYNNEDNWKNEALYIDNYLIEVKDYVTGEFKIKDGTKTIACYAFENCHLTSVTIPNSVESIDVGAFYNCGLLRSVVIPDSVTSIGYNVFYNCGLTSVVIPDSVTSIGYNAFKNCHLTSVVIPDSVTSIVDCAFSGCRFLTSVTIGNSVESIGDYAFDDCESLTIVNYSGTKEQWDKITIGMNNKQLTGATVYYDVNIVEDYVYRILDDGTTAEITGYNGSATKLTIPSELGGKTVTSIGDWAFECCESLRSVVISDSVKSIGAGAFRASTMLFSIVLPNSVTSIGNSAFFGCISLTTVNYGGTKEQWEQIAIGGINNEKLTSATVYYDVNISEDYFYRILDDDTAEIREYNGSATELTIPLTLNGKTVTSIADRAFYNCTSLTSVTIPDSVTSIGDSVFESCKLLKTINYAGTKEQWSIITIGDGNTRLLFATINYGVSSSDCEHKNTVTDKAVDPTCDKTGLTEGSHCKDCGATIKAQTTVKAKGHKTTVKNKKSATCFAKGYTGDTYCSVCKKVVKKGKSIAKKTLKKPTVKITAGKKQIKVKYTKVSGATGFEVQYKIGKKTVTKTFNTKKSATKAIKKLKKGKYKVKVRAFVKSGKKKAYSNWTKTYTTSVK